MVPDFSGWVRGAGDLPAAQVLRADGEAQEIGGGGVETLEVGGHFLGIVELVWEGGVVDGSLGVHGLEHLKLADLSIPPENVGANTGNTAFVIGERAADIFIKELGLEAK